MQKEKSERISNPKLWKKAMNYISKRDRRLAAVMRKYGPIRMHLIKNRYEAILQSFINQQISGSAADSIISKFKKMYGGNFPTPAEFLKARESDLKLAGISTQKYSYIRDFCERISNHEIDLDSIDNLPDEEVIAILDDVRGIGRWTAELFLIFSLGRMNVFPADDLGIANAIQILYKNKERPKREALAKMSMKWHPYKSVATIYLWKSLENR